MGVCTFFGHQNTPNSIRPKLKQTLEELIVKHDVSMFYVGNHGQFDALVKSVLQELKIVYPHIEYAVVLAYMPKLEQNDSSVDFTDSFLPEGIETVYPRYAISWRNKWMLRQADYVVTYVTHSWGGAAQFEQLAKRQHKTVIKLSSDAPGAVLEPHRATEQY